MRYNWHMTLILENPELEARLQAEAIQRGVRPEEIALETLREKFGRRLHHDADFLIGTMSEEEFQEFERNIATFNAFDELDR